MKVIDQFGEVQFRGAVKDAKTFYGTGVRVNEVVDEDGETVIATETYELELVYEEPADDMQYLADTDWYVTRQAETGKAIPSDVKAKRSAIRVRN